MRIKTATISNFYPHWSVALSRYFIFLIVSILSACSTQQMNTQIKSKSALPLSTKEVLLVYGKFRSFGAKGPQTWDEKTIDKFDRALETAVFTQIPAELTKAGIESQTVPAAALNTLQSAKKSTPLVFISPSRNVVTCNGVGGCWHRMTLSVRLLSAGSRQELWSTEIPEPYFTDLSTYAQRSET